MSWQFVSNNPFHGWAITRYPNGKDLRISCPRGDCGYFTIVIGDGDDLGKILDNISNHMSIHAQAFFIRPTL